MSSWITASDAELFLGMRAALTTGLVKKQCCLNKVANESECRRQKYPNVNMGH